jgi:hypothetical protein
MNWLTGRNVKEDMNMMCMDAHDQTYTQVTGFLGREAILPGLMQSELVLTQAVCQLTYLEYRGRWGYDINGNKT